MATKLKEVDVVIVGLGWTGGILAKELTETGLKVVALERGGPRSSENDYSLPNIRDELRYVVRHDLMQNTARDTITVRNNPKQEALPMRRLGSFLPGEVVGGSGVHWSGHTWRWTDMEFKVRSNYEERYGKKFIPDDMTIQDWGITYAELEPYYDKFEYTAAVSGKAGNIGGKIQTGGNPFEAPRERDYPLPPLTPILASEMFSAAARNAGYHSFPRPSANASQPYTNPDGAKFGGCQYCGYCQRFGCEANAKGSPHLTVIPIAMAKPNFELRTHSWVTKVLKDSDGKRVTGVTYTNVLNGDEFEQPATIVLLCAYAINNVHLMLLSGIGTPYDPVSQKGVVGKNYCYQTGAQARLFFEGKYFNPFMNAGGSNATIDDFNANWDFDRAPHNFVGGHIVSGGFNTPPRRAGDQRHRQVDEPHETQPRERADRPLDRGALPKHAQHRRHHHGHQSTRERAQQISAELGLPQSVRGRGQRLPAQFRVQSDRAGGGICVLDRGRDQEPLSEKPWSAGAGMIEPMRVIFILLTTLMLAGTARADGDAGRGQARFQDCSPCHKLEAGANDVGPNLHGIFMRKAGELADFRYSPAMKRSGIVWTPETLEQYIADPQGFVPTNRMPYAGMANANDRADLIAYLQNVTK